MHLFEMKLGPLAGFGVAAATLRRVAADTISEFYLRFPEPIYENTINEGWFRFNDCPDNNYNNVTIFAYCNAFLEEQAKAILKIYAINLAKVEPQSAFAGEMHMTDEAQGYSWSFRVEYSNKTLALWGLGSSIGDDEPGCCATCGTNDLVVSYLDYNLNHSDWYFCPSCGAQIDCSGFTYEFKDYGSDKDLLYFGDMEELEEITELIVPEGITRIPNSAYANCTRLKRLSLPASLLLVEERAFAECLALQNVVVPQSVSYVDEAAFSGCESLKQIILPKRIPVLGFLDGCTSLESITIPGSVKAVESFDFTDCTSLARVDIEEGVENIYGEAFRHCIGLKEVLIPASVTEIDEDAFESRIWKQLTIITPKGSYAEKWALEHGIKTQTE